MMEAAGQSGVILDKENVSLPNGNATLEGSNKGAAEMPDHPTVIDEAKWIPDICRPHCRSCRATFTQRLRRHHCRITGEVICEGCSTKEDIDGTFIRISLKAFKQYHDHFPKIQKTMPRMFFGRQFGSQEITNETQIKRIIMYDNVDDFRSFLTRTEEVDLKLVKDGRRPLHIAAQEGCRTIAAYLLELSAGVNVKDELGRTPLHLAAVQPDPAMAVMLLDAGASFSEMNNHCVTPLHVAAEMSVPVLTEFLGHSDRDLACRDDEGAQTVHYAARQVDGHVEAMELLLEAGVDITATDRDGRTPMHYAAAAGNEAVIRLLYAKGALLEGKDGDGLTPLLSAACANQYGSAKELLQLGSSLHATDANGQTFIELATAAGGLAVIAAVEHLGIGKPSSVTVLPADLKFLRYAIPGTMSSLAGVPRVPSSNRVFKQTFSVHNGSDSETLMFAASYFSTFVKIPGQPSVMSPGSYTVYPEYGFIKPNESVTIKVDLRLPTSRLYKEFETDRVMIRTAKVKTADSIDVESERMWSRIQNHEQTRFVFGVQVRAVGTGDSPRRPGEAPDDLFAL